MTVKLSRFASAFGALLCLASANTASAQWFPFRGLFTPCPCGPTPAMYSPVSYGGCSNGACGVTPTAMINNNSCGCAPVAYAPTCAPAMVAQPVTETVMRQVPVTEYKQVRQTVRKPVTRTTYVDQPVTEYQQVCEPKTVSVPTVAYQDVTECRTVQRNCGQWVTKWHCNQKISPCQYDNRQGFVGEMNRMGFAMRQAFVPAQYATREYQTQVVTQQVPTTRRVAVHGTKQVTYNVNKTVAVQSTRKVAVNTVDYVDEEVVVMQPVTVVKSIPTTQTTYRLVPAGSALAYGSTVTNTALAPTPDPVNAQAAPKKQSAARETGKDRTTDSRNDENPGKGASLERNSSSDEEFNGGTRRANKSELSKGLIRFVAAKAPDSVRIGVWRPTATNNAAKSIQRPQQITATITVAEVN